MNSSGLAPIVITITEFKRLMQTIADGWNEGDARKAADCFTEDTRYTEPPDKQVYVGREALYDFFGGEQKPEPPMFMIWHHLNFDEEGQIGTSEYTFQMNNRNHGMVHVKVRDGKIAHWREYQYQSTLDWQTFTANNPFQEGHPHARNTRPNPLADIASRSIVCLSAFCTGSNR